MNAPVVTYKTLPASTFKTPPYHRLREYGTRQCRQWREELFTKHWPLMVILVNHYERLCMAEDYVVANNWLRVTDERLKLGHTRLWLYSDMQAITDYVDWRTTEWAKVIYELSQTRDLNGVYAAMLERVQHLGIEITALPEQPTLDQMSSTLARLTTPEWLRRQLRVQQSRGLEALLRELGIVSKHKGIYVSDVSYQRRTEQKQRGQRLLESLQAENELGQTYTLAELAALSTSNPINRRHELMTRIRGFEEFAEQANEPWQGVMFTVTCPSKYHAVMAKSGDHNRSFNNSTPTEANGYLNTLWQRTRAAWDKAGIRVFGFRVAEPHHDGTPHWHVLLWVKPEDLEQAEAIFKGYALAEEGDERGAQEQRFHTVRIDPTQGTAAGYIAKYIAKNIDGFGIDTDSYGKDAVTSALRIEAWASLWGIRQFQQIGGASVTVWRELRRLDQEHVEPKLLQQLTEAADNGDWQAYTALMGGAVCPLKDRPVRPMYLLAESLNKYAEAVKQIKGLWLGSQSITTRVHQWVVSAIDQPAANDTHALDNQPAPNAVLTLGEINDVASIDSHDFSDLALAPAGASPWTCVNNCSHGWLNAEKGRKPESGVYPVKDDMDYGDYDNLVPSERDDSPPDADDFTNDNSPNDNWAGIDIPLDAYEDDE